MAKALTAAAISKFKGGAKRQEIPDAHTPGLYFLVQPSGAKSWAVRARVDGRLLKFTIGKYLAGDDQARAGAELSKARAEAAEIIRQAKAGANPRQVKADAEAAQKLDREDKAKASFEACVREFLKRHASKKKTWRETARTLGLVAGEGDRNDLKLFVASPEGLCAKWGDRHIGAIKRRDIVAHLDEVMDAGHPYAANRRLAALSKMFSWAVERGMVDGSPCAGIGKPGDEKFRDRILSDDEMRLLLLACNQVGGLVGDFVKFLAYTAQRRNECAGLMWKEVDGDLWTIPAARSKNGVASIVPLSASAAAILAGRDRIAGPGYAFTIGGGAAFSGFAAAKIAIDKAMAAAAPEGAVIPPWRFHDLRRSAASGMARLGIQIPVVEKLLNHSSGTFKGIVSVYQKHDFAPEKRFACDAWAAHLDGLLAEKPADNVVPMARAS